MKAILFLAILFMLVGTAASGKLLQGPPLKVPHDSQVSYELLSGIGLLTGVPGFAAGWGNSSASVTVPDGKVTNVTAITALTINDLEGINTRVDPSVELNMSVVSVSGSSSNAIDLKNLNTEGFNAIAFASGSADTKAVGLHEAWTAGQFEPITDVTYAGAGSAITTSISSISSGGAAAIADFRSIFS